MVDFLGLILIRIGGQLRPDQRLHFIPYIHVTFDLGVRPHEHTSIPGKIGAIVGARQIAEAEITEDFRAIWVGGANFGFAVEEAIPLVEIYGLCDIRRNNYIVLADFRNTIHLNGEQHRDAIQSQTAGQGDRLRGAPAMSIKNNSGISLFSVDKVAVVIFVQDSKDFPVGFVPVPVLKSLDDRSTGIFLAEPRCQLNLYMDRVIALNESSYKSEDDGGRCRGNFSFGNWVAEGRFPDGMKKRNPEEPDR